MPAYRSADEAEIRGAVVSHLRQVVPGCRIIHEINASSFGNRIDVLAVGRDTLVAVEIKSKRDKLDRLPDQIKAMSRVTPLLYAAIHEKFLESGNIGHFPPDAARGAITWVYPRMARPGHVEVGQEWRMRDNWQKRDTLCLPQTSLGILWREELQAVAQSLGVPRSGKLTMSDAIDEILYRCDGKRVKTIVCQTLRRRVCTESDEPLTMD